MQATRSSGTPRQMLHAWRLSFRHPLSGEPLAFTAPPPADFPAAILGATRRMQRIVVTGNPGSGKSALTAALAAQGLPAFSADADVAALYARGGEAAAWLGSLKGEAVLAADGSVDKGALMAALAKDPALRAELERVVHGLVRRDLERFWEASEEGGAPAAVAEVPLYFECGWDTAFTPRPVTIGVACPQRTRWERMAANRHWGEAKMATLESWQWPEGSKLGACDIRADNTGTPAELAAQAPAILDSLAARRREEEAALAEHLRKLWAAPAPQV